MFAGRSWSSRDAARSERAYDAGVVTSVFHAGERAVQSRAGVRAQSEAIGSRVIRAQMPEQHRTFFAQQPWLLLGSVDAGGWPHASVLAGPPGFVQAPDPGHLRVEALPDADDPLADALRVGARIGVLGIELPTRRRNRMNGEVIAVDERGFSIAVRQSFGNCPKYIQARAWGATERARGGVTRGTGLDPRWVAIVEAADTCFLASVHADPAAGGVDVSHRGGAPGFMRAGTDGRLWLPDYAGNLMFNTLGNLVDEPRCGLLVVDFASGDLLHVAARAEVVWPEAFERLGEPAPDGAERMVALEPGAWLLRRGRLGLTFGEPSPSPFLP